MHRAVDRALELVAWRQVQRRSFNERLVALGTTDADAGPLAFRCECALIGCGSAIKLTAGEYAEVRGNPRWFAVLAAHVSRDVESAVATTREWAVVEKPVGPGADIAVSMAPRGVRAVRA